VSGRPPVAPRSPGTDAAAAPLDLLLAAGALGPARRLLPGGAGARFATALARRPHRVARRATALAGELAQVGLGRSSLAAAPTDRRFTDPAWTSNPLLRRLLQAYLAAGRTAEELLTDADLAWRDTERLRFVADNLVQALAPSNQPLTSPDFWKALIDSGGASLVRGARHLAADLAAPPRVPTMVAPDAFEVGTDLAVTPGAVVLRTPVFELLQYRPRTPRVRRVPLLVVPPTINKYYIVDLAPGRSLVEYLVDRAAVAASAARGYLDGRTLAEVFAWLRPGRDLVGLAVGNALTRQGAATMLGSPVDLAKVDIDAYLVAGAADRLCPWQACYRSTRLLGGRSWFVLSTSGHIAPWSTRRGTGRPASGRRPTTRRTRPTGWPGRPPKAAPGGPTSSAGWSGAAAGRRPGPGGSVPPASRRSTRPLAPMSWTAEAAP
jgi:hypothetical protein